MPRLEQLLQAPVHEGEPQGRLPQRPPIPAPRRVGRPPPRPLQARLLLLVPRLAAGRLAALLLLWLPILTLLLLLLPAVKSLG